MDPEEKSVCFSGIGVCEFPTEEGYYFVNENGLLHYFDIKSKTTVVVCDKAECEHRVSGINEKPSCNAEIMADSIAVYRDKLYYLTPGSQYNSEKLCCRDLDGNNDTEIAEFRGQLRNALPSCIWFYRDSLFVITEVFPAGSFDAESKNMENSTVRLNCINLETGKCDVIQESSGTAGYGYSIYKTENGRAFYYSIEKECFFEYDMEKKTLTKQDVLCQVKIAREGKKDKIPYEYQFAYGDYCYGVSGELFARDKLLKTNIKTGKEEVFFNNGVGLNQTISSDYLIIADTSQDQKHVGSYRFYLYDMINQKLTELHNSFLQEQEMTVPHIVTNEGMIYSWAVNKKENQVVYDGDFEYRFISMEDLLAGKDTYTTIYHLLQTSAEDE